jgi:hypothetical protein
VRGLSDVYCCQINPYYHSRGDTLGAGLNDIPFVTKVAKVGVATLAELAVPIGPGIEETQNSKLKIQNLRNYPNPFSYKTVIQFNVGAYCNTLLQLQIYDLSGRVIKTFLINQSTNQLINYITWDGKDNNGNKVPSGIYLYKLSGLEDNICKKIILIR